MKLKQMTVAMALALSVPASAFAVQGVLFDPDGVPGGAAPTVVDTFDWKPGHVLYSDCFGAGAIGVVGGCLIKAQGSIGTISLTGSGNITIPAGVSFTFAMDVAATVSLGKGSAYDGGTVNVGDTLLLSDGGGSSLFTIFADNADDAVPLTGAGYTDGTAILKGTVKVNSYALTNVGSATQLFDQFGGDDYAGRASYQTSGSPSFTVEVSYIDPAWFKDPLVNFTVQIGDVNQSENSLLPFKQVDPSHSVNGTAFTPTATLGGAGIGTDAIVDIYCGTTKSTATCGGEFQGDAASVFLTQTTPEPGMLALLGIGLAGIGVFSRRRSKAA